MKGFFCSNDHSTNYAEMIVEKRKTIETRNKNMLKNLVGERVAVIRTGKGKPMVIGYVDITACSFCNEEDFPKYFYQHWVLYMSKYYVKTKGKYFYHLANAEKCIPYQLPENAIRHGRSWCEF